MHILKNLKYELRRGRWQDIQPLFSDFAFSSIGRPLSYSMQFASSSVRESHLAATTWSGDEERTINALKVARASGSGGGCACVRRVLRSVAGRGEKERERQEMMLQSLPRAPLGVTFVTELLVDSSSYPLQVDLWQPDDFLWILQDADRME